MREQEQFHNGQHKYRENQTGSTWLWVLALVAFVVACVGIGLAAAAFSKNDYSIDGNLEVDGTSTFHGDVKLPPAGASGRGGTSLTIGKIKQLGSETALTPLSVVLVDDSGTSLQAIDPKMGWLTKQNPVLWVSDDGDDDNDGLSDAEPLRSVQSALTLLADPSVAWTGQARVVIMGTLYTPMSLTWDADIGDRHVIVQGGGNFQKLGEMETSTDSQVAGGSGVISLTFSSLLNVDLGAFVRVNGRVYPVTSDLANHSLILSEVMLNTNNPFPVKTLVEFLEPSCTVSLPTLNGSSSGETVSMFTLQSSGTIETQMLRFMPSHVNTWIVTGGEEHTDGKVKFGPGTEIYTGHTGAAGKITKIHPVCSTQFDWMSIVAPDSSDRQVVIATYLLTQETRISMNNCSTSGIDFQMITPLSCRSCIFGSVDSRAFTKLGFKGGDASFDRCSFVLADAIEATGAKVGFHNCNINGMDGAIFNVHDGGHVRINASEWTGAKFANVDTQSTLVSLDETAQCATLSGRVYISINHDSHVNLVNTIMADDARVELDGETDAAITPSSEVHQQNNLGGNGSVFLYRQRSPDL
jgi:hypothetical protein